MPAPRAAVVIENGIVVPRTALDHAGYRDWVKSDEYPERLRTTFVDGEVLVEMTPESIEAHNKIKTAMTVAFCAVVQTRDLGEVYSDGVLVTNEEAGLSCELDLTFVSWAAFEEGRVRLVERASGTDYIEILGSPDVVVEIVSDSSVRKDTRLLRDAYFRAGVLEYWIADARGVGIRFEILRRGSDRFIPSGPPTDPQKSQVLAGRWTLTRSGNRAGRFTYTLVQAS